MTRLLILFAFVLEAQDTPQWQPTGLLLNPRPDACVVSFSDGRVLVTGGSSTDGPQNSAEVYLPTEGVFVPFTSMDKPRAGHRCLRLSGDQILLLGGEPGDVLTASVYTPETDTWTTLPDLGPNRSAFSATILDDTRILIAGGLASGTPLDRLLILDPVTFAASPLTATLAVPRYGHTATLLLDGRIIFTGGISADGPTASVELLDAGSDSFPLRLNMITPRRDHTATLLHDGRLLIVGGSDNVSDLASAEVFTPGEDSLTALDARLATARRNHFAILVQQNGSVILGGGSESSAPLASTELFSPDSNTFTTVGALTAPRTNILAALLPDARILAIGGTNAGGPSRACGILNSIIEMSFPGVSLFDFVPTFFSSDLVEASGKFPAPGQVVTFTLSRTVNSVTTDISSRLLTRSLTLSATGSFPVTPFFRVNSTDIPATYVLAASTTTGSGLLAATFGTSRSFKTKFRTTLTGSILPSNPTITGQPVRFSYRISSDGPSALIPGLISAKLGTLSASASPNLTGLGAFEVCCPSSPGPLEASVSYAGTSTHAPATTATFTHQVVSNLPTLSLRQPAAGLRLLTPATIEAQVSAPSGVSSPQVTGSVRLGTQVLTLVPAGSTSTASINYSPTFDDRRNGNVCFAASYSGSTAYQPIAPVNQCFPVSPAAAKLVLSVPGNNVSFGQSSNITITLNFNPELGLSNRLVSLTRFFPSSPSTPPVAAGLVELAVSAPGIATATLPLTLATSFTPDSIRASIAASGDIDAAEANFSPLLAPIATRITVAPPASPATNPFTLAANLCTVTPVPTPGIGGTVEFFDGTLSLGRVTIAPGTVLPTCDSGTKSPSFTLTGVSRPAGLRQITARFLGFSPVQTSTSPAAQVTVQ